MFFICGICWDDVFVEVFGEDGVLFVCDLFFCGFLDYVIEFFVGIFEVIYCLVVVVEEGYDDVEEVVFIMVIMVYLCCVVLVVVMFVVVFMWISLL